MVPKLRELTQFPSRDSHTQRCISSDCDDLLSRRTSTSALTETWLVGAPDQKGSHILHDKIVTNDAWNVLIWEICIRSSNDLGRAARGSTVRACVREKSQTGALYPQLLAIFLFMGLYVHVGTPTKETEISSSRNAIFRTLFTCMLGFNKTLATYCFNKPPNSYDSQELLSRGS